VAYVSSHLSVLSVDAVLQRLMEHFNFEVQSVRRVASFALNVVPATLKSRLVPS
jgi:uncharacterized membrane protein YczE